MLNAIIIPFLTILAAEFFDKSQLSLFLLATKTKHHLQLLFGALIAFALVDGLAIILGSFLSSLIPEQTLQIAAGVLFIFFGIVTFFSTTGKDVDKSVSPRNAFFSTIGLILVAEMGDKTQLVTGVFATQYPPLLVFIGIMAAFTILSIVAIYMGKLLSEKVNVLLLRRVSSIIFILLGIFFLVS